MTACAAPSIRHDGLDLRPVRIGLRPELLILCSGCRLAAATDGLVRIVERRSVDLPVTHDRRRFVPAWLRGLTAREDGSWRVA